MSAVYAELDQRIAVASVLGYLNFSDGKPDPGWQRNINEAWGFLANQGFERPWEDLFYWLRSGLEALSLSGQAAFRDVTQAHQVLNLAQQSLIAYRAFHADLLPHLTDAELYGPFFLARVFEAALAARAHDEAAAEAVVARLNDYIGHRPVAILETRPLGEPYPHEKTRPLPLYLREVGVAYGPYRTVVTRCLEILSGTDPNLLAEAQLDLRLLEELALDVRAYDHGHPTNRRPNYVFGEWDGQHLDLQGRYRRYIVRKITLDALMDRVLHPGSLAPDEALFEGAAVLAGTILMGCGVCGMSPTSHDSTTTLANLLPRIARYRDSFYEHLLGRLQGEHAQRLRGEVASTRQAFGAARQHLNAYLARHRATQLQHRYLALLFAEMGYPQASRVEAQRIPAASIRMQAEILGQLTSGRYEVDAGRLDEAAARLPVVEDLLHRGIACGALVDPWNILGFQGLFPLSPAREDSIRDPRIEELFQIIESTFNLYARLMSEAAALGRKEMVRALGQQQQKLADWWDQFATTTVSDLRSIHGAEAVASARHVGKALLQWHDRGEASADLAFWRDQLTGFRSPKAYALVVDSLLRKHDYRSAVALLISWLEQGERVALEDGPHSFHGLILRWMLTLTDSGSESKIPLTGEQRRELIVRCFAWLEANADEYWDVPSLFNSVPLEEHETNTAEDRFESAYEDVTYRDTTDDGEQGAVSEGGPEQLPYDLEEESERLERRLRFLSTLSRLWQIASRYLSGVRSSEPLEPDQARGLRSTLSEWLGMVQEKQAQLLGLLDTINDHPVPEPSGDYDSLVEYDRRRVLKEQLIYTTIGTAQDSALAVTALRGACAVLTEQVGEEQTPPQPGVGAPPWEALAIRLERDLFRGDAAAVRDTLPRFLVQFREEPLLFAPLTEGGAPRQILRVRLAQTILRALLANLPRLGLLREAYELLRTARAMEQHRPLRGRGVTEFNHFFQTAYQAVVDCLIVSAPTWPEDQRSDEALVRLLERLSAPFLSLWIEHSRSLQLSVLEGVGADTEWHNLRTFVLRYGSELFHARFMTLGNLRGVLHRGIGAFLDYLSENVDPLKPSTLVADLERGTLRREEAIRRLEVILQAVIENYEEYKDYNATTTQSDYGENLWVLLDFLRLKVAYDRNAWQFKPMTMAHEILAKRGRPGAAQRWQEALENYTRDMARQHMESLERLERERSIRLGTIRDRVSERFLKTLALDRMSALIEPAMEAARSGVETGVAFAQLLVELQPQVANPVGVGLDVPYWLRRLENEVHRVQASHTTIASLAEHFFRVQRRPLALEDLLRQLTDWLIPSLPQ